MRRLLPILAILALWAPAAHAHGILIPDDVSVPPLAMLHHKVAITIDDQAATTRVEQTFRNHTDRPLEATYVFPAPEGASVKEFSMWINGKEVKGELIEAKKAAAIYTDVIRRSQNPALLEYMNRGLFKLKVSAIPAKADQKVMLTYASIAERKGDTIEYTYPLKTDGKATATLEELAFTGTVKSQHNVQNLYSPTHAIDVKRASDKEVTFSFARNQGVLDKDFQVFYSLGTKDIGVTTLTHRPIKDEDGFFLMLLSPKVELPKDFQIPRDVVLVLDTSGSMRGPKLDQAKKALNYCLGQLTDKDRFAVIEFSAKVNKYRAELTPAKADELDAGKKWVDSLKATGGTNINDALLDAMDMRSNDMGRTFTIIFFTDGMPSTSEKDPEKILKNVAAKNTANTRIFSFGVGDDVNASFLDRLSESTRGVSTYVRPAEDIETKTAALYSKISHPVLANLKLTVGGADVTLQEVYPPQLPDLYKGGQVVVMGRYQGKGKAEVKLIGQAGTEVKEFTYPVEFVEKTKEDREFVEHLWARRKVGYLLDQIRVNGEKKELVDEVTALAKKYGIATPYTSYLVVTEGPVAAGNKRPGGGAGAPAALQQAPGAAPLRLADFAKQTQGKAGEGAANRNNYEDRKLDSAPMDGLSKAEAEAFKDAKEKKAAYDQARAAFFRRDQNSVQNGKLGVDLSVQSNNLRNQCRLEQTALRKVAGRTCLEIGGVWIDEGFDSKTTTLTVKAMSEAYFRILERHPEVKEVFRLGNHVVWVTPSGIALVVDSNDGKEKLSDEEVDKLFKK
ncbi:MAG: VWA domain-containing protein [Gemmataceae bacterium]|nr:VWA domain-containing protein [Gemmataceae bacterium]